MITIGNAREIVARRIVSDWLALHDPMAFPQLTLQSSEALQLLIANALADDEVVGEDRLPMYDRLRADIKKMSEAYQNETKLTAKQSAEIGHLKQHNAELVKRIEQLILMLENEQRKNTLEYHCSEYHRLIDADPAAAEVHRKLAASPPAAVIPTTEMADERALVELSLNANWIDDAFKPKDNGLVFSP